MLDIKGILGKSCNTLLSTIRRLDEEEFRRTNKGFPRGYLKNFDFNSIEWKRYIQIFNLINVHKSRAKQREYQALELGTGLGVFTLAYRLAYPDDQLVSLDHPTIAAETTSSLFPVLEKHGVGMVGAKLDSALPFADNSFDIVFFLAVIEHLANSPRELLDEIYRILRPEGVLILDTPNLGAFERRYNMLFQGKGPFFEIDHFFYSEPPFSGHHREYNLNELTYMLGEKNFSVVESCYFDCAPRKVQSIKTMLAIAFTFLFPSLRHAVSIIAQPVKRT